MPITYTGRNVKPGSATYPSLVDLAVGLSRQPRFAGQGKRWFSVLDHSLFADEIAKRIQDVDVPLVGQTWDEWPALSRDRLRLAVLLHDGHESITSDVVTPFKGIELKQAQARLDEGIMGAFFPGGYEAYTHPNVANMVRHIDRRALAAESRVIGPQVSPERILSAFGITDDTPDDIKLLEQLLTDDIVVEGFGIPPLAVSPQDKHPGVKEYLRRVLELL